MSENWIVQNIQLALYVWSGKLAEIRTLITEPPQEFRGGTIWNVILNVHGALQAVGLALLVLFFAAGVMKTCGSFAELKRPEHALKLLIRFVLAKTAVTYGLELMTALLEIVQGMIGTVLGAAGFGDTPVFLIPDEIVTAIEGVGYFESIPLWAVSMIGALLIWVLSFVMILHVYGRFFKLYLYTAIAPVPMAAFAGEPTQNIGKSFLKSYAAVCLEGVVIVLSCVIFSVFAANQPSVDPDAAVTAMIWTYLGEVIFNMLILVGCVKAADRIVKELLLS